MKKGSLSLSVNAIVVMVIAFVVLGLILTFTRQIFQFGTSKTGEIFDTTSLDTQPTASNPITLPDTISIRVSEEKQLRVGFYNRNPFPATEATFEVYDCQGEVLQGTTRVTTTLKASNTNDKKFLPVIISPAVTVGASKDAAFKIFMKMSSDQASPLKAGTFICTIVVRKKGSTYNAEALTPKSDNMYESKQIFLQVVG